MNGNTHTVYNKIYFDEIDQALLNNSLEESSIEYGRLIIEPVLIVLRNTSNPDETDPDKPTYSTIDRIAALNSLSLLFKTQPIHFLDHIQQAIDQGHSDVSILLDSKQPELVNFWHKVELNLPDSINKEQKLWLLNLLDKNTLRPDKTDTVIDQNPTSDDKLSIRKQVSKEFEEAKEFAKTLNPKDVQSGQWFVSLFQRVIKAYDSNATSEYLQNKYPGLPPDEIADILTSLAVRYATMAGAIAGVGVTANEIAALGTAGLTVGIIATTIGAEMIYITRLQMRLILDLAVVYDLQLDPDDPEDTMMILGYALGVTPAEIVGKGLQHVAREGTRTFIRTYVNKGVLKTIKSLGRRIGLKIVQGTIIKYAVPVASVGIGSTYNNITTKAVGRYAKTHFKTRGKANDELRILISRKNTYDLIFPATILHLVEIDGDPSSKKHELYKAMLSRMSFNNHSTKSFNKLISSEETILSSLANLNNKEDQSILFKLLILTAIYDGALVQSEAQFLEKIANMFELEIDLKLTGKRAEEYRIETTKTFLEKASGRVSNATSKAKILFSRLRKKQPEQAIAEAIICTKCEHNMSSQFKFCPNCGESTATEKKCTGCTEVIPADFAFCPHCGLGQS